MDGRVDGAIIELFVSSWNYFRCSSYVKQVTEALFMDRIIGILKVSVEGRGTRSSREPSRDSPGKSSQPWSNLV